MSILQGDCRDILKNMETESVDMVYLDPPFFTQKTHNLKTRNNDTEYLFDDCWESAEHYINFIKERVKECHRVLKKTATYFCIVTKTHPTICV